MTDSTHETLSFEADFAEFECEYDPLMDEEDERDADELAETYGYLGDPGELAPHTDLPSTPPRTPQEKIADLFANMIPYKRFFLAIMDYCREPQRLEDVDDFVAQLQAHRSSVYTATSFCQMLADAEALEKIGEGGKPYTEVEVEPEEFEDENGIISLRPSAPPTVFWRTTEDGCCAVDEDNPTETLKGIIAEKARYKPVFMEILKLCDEGEGASINEIRDQVNSNPILVNPPKTAQFFMDYLDRNGAIVWTGKWRTTDVGKEVLALIGAR